MTPKLLVLGRKLGCAVAYKTNIYALHLDLIKDVFDGISLYRSLEPLAHAIRDSVSTIEAVRRADAGYYQFVVDEETEVIETYVEGDPHLIFLTSLA